MSGRCRVLFLIPSLGGGGAERVLVTLLRHMDPTRFAISLGVLDLSTALHRDMIPPHVSILDLRCARVRNALWKIVSIAWSTKPDVIFATLGYLNLALALIKPFLPRRTRVIGREATVVSLNLGRDVSASFQRICFRHVYKRLDRIFCQSLGMRDDLVQHFSLPMGKTFVVPNPVDADHVRMMALQGTAVPEVQRQRDESLRLVAAGRLSFEKGFDLLIGALALCKDLNVHLTLLGEGPLKDALQRLARETGVYDRVLFVGFQKNPYPWLLRSDVFILSSRYEGFPNVVLEALACGTPVIATPAPGGTREILATIPECEIVDEISAGAIAGAIRRWSGRPRLRVSRDVLEPYSVHGIVTRYEDEILRVAGMAQ